MTYKQKIDAGRTVLVTTEIESCEGRKLWMHATVRCLRGSVGRGGQCWQAQAAAQARCTLGAGSQQLGLTTSPCIPSLSCSDGPQGKVYATARALFVAPKPLRAVQDVGRFVLRRVFGDGS